MICLYGLGLIGLAVLRAPQVFPAWLTAADAVVYLRSDVSPAEEQAAWEELKKWPEFTSIRIVTRDEAYGRLEKQLGPWREVLSGMGRDYLQPSLEVSFQDSFKEWERREEIIARMRLVPDVAEVLYGNGEGDRLKSILGWVGRGLWLSAGALVLLFTCAHWGWTLVMISGSRDELEVLWWVGAPDWLIRLPFLLSSWAAGALGTIMALGLLAVTTHSLETSLPLPFAALCAVDFGEWLLLGFGMTGISLLMGSLGVCLTTGPMRRVCSDDRSS
ncbi:MAG: permease-like cell division protein FtsX [Syntrophobacteraceae bacterium]|nr:permease-like cell division protein FtsX [Syntrophobacteraceae bacterium]